MAAFWGAAKYIKLQEIGIDPNIIGSQSLRAWGAMDLKIMGYTNYTIIKYGRWKSDTWQMYMHIQVSKLYEGVAKNMITPVR